jgi:hypothetical protein
MSIAPTNTWGNIWDIHTWTVVRADLDIAHVMLPLHHFSMKSAGTNGGFNLARSYQTPEPDCFKDVVFNTAGEKMPGETELKAIEPLYDDPTNVLPRPLPLFNSDNEKKYYVLACKLGAYLATRPELLRLEAQVKIPCHGFGSKIRDGRLQGHAPMIVNTPLQVYVFPDVVQPALGSDLLQSLLVVRTPLSPACPFNGDGTAIGFGRK